MKSLVITGGTGFIGMGLATYFSNKADQVIIISRHPLKDHDNIKYCYWDGKTQGKWSKMLEHADAVINLAGKSVNCRYNDKNKREILNSRINATKAIEQAINDCQYPPKVWINAASATIYPHAEDKDMKESNTDFHNDFSVNVCLNWEKAFNEALTTRTRKVVLRIAITLGDNDGVVPRFVKLARMGLGGAQGNGQQFMSWIHEHDLCRIMEFCIQNQQINGTYNASAPYPISNGFFMQQIRENLNIPLGLKAPAWLLKIGALLIGTETELLLKSRRVVPEKLLKAGFKFQFETIGMAMSNLIKK